MKPVLAVHAGAWRMPGRLEVRHVQAMHDALKAGFAAMPKGALEAVTAAVASMEKSGDVNAGSGGVLNREKKRELDAMVMDSAFNAGSVASLSATTEAVRIARCV
ncbi:MAG: isoaspartyl peptidase/L-asparaginase, partial [Candidatus Micrarchaeota archaeon]|nr:isoaspartyl peptidase/L-asparaginase [Candidatus Micrarchaeota archaeon]